MASNLQTKWYRSAGSVEMTLCGGHSVKTLTLFRRWCSTGSHKMQHRFKYQRVNKKYRPRVREIIIIIVVFTITSTCLRNLCHLFPHSQSTQPGLQLKRSRGGGRRALVDQYINTDRPRIKLLAQPALGSQNRCVRSVPMLRRHQDGSQ